LSSIAGTFLLGFAARRPGFVAVSPEGRIARHTTTLKLWYAKAHPLLN